MFISFQSTNTGSFLNEEVDFTLSVTVLVVYYLVCTVFMSHWNCMIRVGKTNLPYRFSLQRLTSLEILECMIETIIYNLSIVFWLGYG